MIIEQFLFEDKRYTKKTFKKSKGRRKMQYYIYFDSHVHQSSKPLCPEGSMGTILISTHISSRVGTWEGRQLFTK